MKKLIAIALLLASCAAPQNKGETREYVIKDLTTGEIKEDELHVKHEAYDTVTLETTCGCGGKSEKHKFVILEVKPREN